MNDMLVLPTVNKKLSRSGFTLVELMVATGVLGFVLTAVIAFFVNAIALNEISRNLTTALSHAQYIFEDIRIASYSNVPDQISGGTWNWNAAMVSARGLTALKNESIATTCTGTSFITVTVTISWNEASGRSRSLALTTQMGGG